MQSILLVCCVISAAIAVSTKCHSCFFGVCYQRSKIYDGQVTGQLAVDHTQNILYFHSENHSLDYSIAYNLNDVIYTNVPGISFTFARTVDQRNQDVYMSATTGIYKYTPSSNNTVLLSLPDKTIWHLQYTDKLYYNVHSESGLYVLENKRSVAIPALSTYKIIDFVVDKLGDIYFVSDTTLYRLKKDGKTPERFSGELYALSTDRYGNAFFTQTGTCGVYKRDYSGDGMVSAGAFGVGTPLKVAFDNINNVIYYDSDSQALYFLRPTYGRCKVTNKRVGKKRIRVKVAKREDKDEGSSSGEF